MKSLIKWKNQNLKKTKRMNNNFHIPDLVQVFPYNKQKNVGSILVLKLAYILRNLHKIQTKKGKKVK